jgi:deoxyribodipyrimidine photo-lyase
MAIIHWFRRDLRLKDNTSLFQAARDARDGIVPVFIFDNAILKSPDCGGPIVQFMLACLAELQQGLHKAGGDLVIRHGKPLDELRKVAHAFKAEAIYFNKDYDPEALARDDEVRRILGKEGINVRGFKDLVIFEEHEILSASADSPYAVYSPYRNAWMKKLKEEGFDDGKLKVLPTPRLNFAEGIGNRSHAKETRSLPALKELGFEEIKELAEEPGEGAGRRRLARFCEKSISAYPTTRNFPALPDGTSRLSAHLRHGTISIRHALRSALEAKAHGDASVAKGVDVWIAELVWREFYQQIVFNFPDVKNDAFKKKFADLPWRHSRKEFAWWTDGKTGCPIVDAGMRQLNAIGWMHNRVRMVTAMFLTKDQQIDYKWGERYFAQRLIDFEVSQNNGNWQWSASTGTDAQPWFRIFNPASQSKKFDPDGIYIRKWVPELADVPAKFIHEPHLMTQAQQIEYRCRIGQDYPAPVVDHAEARVRALKMFQAAIGEGKVASDASALKLKKEG